MLFVDWPLHFYDCMCCTLGFRERLVDRVFWEQGVECFVLGRYGELGSVLGADAGLAALDRDAVSVSALVGSAFAGGVLHLPPLPSQ